MNTFLGTVDPNRFQLGATWVSPEDELKFMGLQLRWNGPEGYIQMDSRTFEFDEEAVITQGVLTPEGEVFRYFRSTWERVRLNPGRLPTRLYPEEE